MSSIQQRHKTAISLLKRLDLDYVELERQRDGYRYLAWSNPVPAIRNGSPPTVKRGKIRIAS
jgi:hypothetical protein